MAGALPLTRPPCGWASSRGLGGLTDIQLPDTQLSDTQVPDIQVPGHPGPRTPRSFGHPGPWTFKSPDVQAFRTSRSFGHTGPWTYKSPDNQVFRTSRSYSQVFGQFLENFQIFGRFSDFWMIFRFLDDKCWHDISNTNIYIQLTHTPQIVGSIYPIQIYIFKNVHSPTLCPKGTQKPSNLHSSPKCWHDISNINLHFPLTYFNLGAILEALTKGPFWHF